MKFKTECSMADGKMVSLLQGDSGAFCHFCSCTKVFNDVANFQNGFNIDKNYETCLEAWRKLEDGSIEYTSGERQGQCHEPIIKSSMKCFSILHWKLRSLDFVQKILYHMVAGYKDWSESGVGYVQVMLKNSKELCRDHIRATCKILIDTPSDGGNTNEGKPADQFFDPKNRENICSLILNTNDRENYAYLFSMLNVVLNVTQSVDMKKKGTDIKS